MRPHLDDIGPAAIRDALRAHAGNLTHAARALGITRDALRRRVEHYDLGADRGNRLDDVAAEALRAALALHKGNLSQAAGDLGIGRNAFTRRLRHHAIDLKEFRA